MEELYGVDARLSLYNTNGESDHHARYSIQYKQNVLEIIVYSCGGQKGFCIFPLYRNIQIERIYLKFLFKIRIYDFTVLRVVIYRLVYITLLYLVLLLM